MWAPIGVGGRGAGGGQDSYIKNFKKKGVGCMKWLFGYHYWLKWKEIYSRGLYSTPQSYTTSYSQASIWTPDHFNSFAAILLCDVLLCAINGLRYQGAILDMIFKLGYNTTNPFSKMLIYNRNLVY